MHYLPLALPHSPQSFAAIQLPTRPTPTHPAPTLHYFFASPSAFLEQEPATMWHPLTHPPTHPPTQQPTLQYFFASPAAFLDQDPVTM